MRRHLLALLSIAACITTLPAAAQDICADLFKQGYDDENATLTSQQNYQYIQRTFCSDSAETFDQANGDKFNLGVKGLDLMDATLSGKTDAGNYAVRRTLFCSHNLDTAGSSPALLGAIKTVGAAATAAVKQCFVLHPDFSIAVTPKDTLDGFAVTIRDNTGAANVTAISSDNGPVQCDKTAPATVTPPFTFNCSKPQDKTILLSVTVEGKGSLSGIELYGTDRAIPDMQNAIAALTQAAAAGTAAAPVPAAAAAPAGTSAPAAGTPAAISCLGCIVASVLAENDFKKANGDGWALCHGQSIAGSKLAEATGERNAPDLRGVFLRGKNDGRFPSGSHAGDVAEHDLGAYSPDTVGPHQHKIMVPGDAPAPPGTGISSSFNDHGAVREDRLVRSWDGATETQPKNVTVNYYCKIN
jgi:hypothetical protein